jgi:hypothetical protein
MNNFTKEELKNLILFVDGGIRYNNHAIELRKKIQSMIDNYCEHDKSGNTHPVDMMCGKVQCGNCGLVYRLYAGNAQTL